MENTSHFQPPADEAWDIFKSAVDVAKKDSVDPQFVKAVNKLSTTLKDNAKIKKSKARSGSSQNIGRYTGSTEGLYRPSPVGFEQLRNIAYQNPIQQSIVRTLSRIISAHNKPTIHEHEMGFQVKLRGASGKSISESEAKKIQWLEKYISNCGAEFNPFQRDSLGRCDFRTFLKKVSEDTLILDAMPVEIVRTTQGRPHGFTAVDGANIYLAPPDGLPSSTPLPRTEPDFVEDLPDRENVYAIERIEGNVTNWFTRDELLYKVRNPRVDIYGEGYGISETEMILRVMSGLLNALNYNYRSYEDNHIPKGFLHLFGEYDENDVEEFKQEWDSFVTGVNNAFHAPILLARNKEAGAEFINTGVDINDMMYTKQISLMVALHCGVYGLAPEELHIESFSSKSSTLSDPSVEGKLAASQIQGILPLKEHFSSVLTYIIQEIEEDAYVVFTGDKDEKDSWEKLNKAITFGELRDLQGLSSTGNEKLDACPIDPTMSSIYMQLLQQEQAEQGQMGEGQGLEGEGNDELTPEVLQQIYDQLPEAEQQKIANANFQDGAEQEEAIIEAAKEEGVNLPEGIENEEGLEDTEVKPEPENNGSVEGDEEDSREKEVN